MEYEREERRERESRAQGGVVKEDKERRGNDRDDEEKHPRSERLGALREVVGEGPGVDVRRVNRDELQGEREKEDDKRHAAVNNR